MLNSDDIEILEEVIKNTIISSYEGSFSIKIIDSGSCNGCDLEISALRNACYDIERFGIKFVPSTEYANAIFITGCLTRNLNKPVANKFKKLWEPGFVAAIGDCPVDGGVFKGSYAILDGIKGKLDVDLWIEGCPPEPAEIRSAFFSSLALFFKRLEKNDLKTKS